MRSVKRSPEQAAALLLAALAFVAGLTVGALVGYGARRHAELSAVRVALAITDAPELRARPLVVRSDSEYTIGALTAPREPYDGAANAKLIRLVRTALRGRPVAFEHVKGHSGIAGNERADELAGLARLRGKVGEEAQAAAQRRAG